MPVLSEIRDHHAPIKLWVPASEVEADALAQLVNTASLPFIFKHLAVMPDVHVGKGATVGSVVATKGAIVPACVGVDIGCGMMAVKTPLDPGRLLDKAGELRARIENVIPLGFDSNKNITSSVETWPGWRRKHSEFLDKNLEKNALRQLGSLGGGNHFIEICLDQNEDVWVMLHSGSRHVGNTLAERHIHEAQSLMRTQKITLPDRDLAYLTEETEEFADYLKDLRWCQDYALQNRVEMMDRVMDLLAKSLNGGRPVPRLLEVNCHHNYVERERHFGEIVWVTRKGAVRAEEGDWGIIPGSMGTKSYIVKGKGNGDSFNSCSHGAGRRMSRGEAKRRFSVQDLVEQTKGVECRKDGHVLDEIPSAYKDIDEVMRNQADLAEIVHELKQVLVVKG
jgi:tRNA-splicing ligase RtcB (3'-phosphate/5'-hydroxy nucleic acid ligase)